MGSPHSAAPTLPCPGLDAASRPRNQSSASAWLDPRFADCIAVVIHHKSIILRSSKGHFKEVKSLTKYIENLRHFKDLWKHFAWGLLGSFSLAWLLGPGEAQPNCLGHTEQILHSPWDPCRPKSLNFCSWGDGGIFASSYKLGYWVRAWGTGLMTHNVCWEWVALSSHACESLLCPGCCVRVWTAFYYFFSSFSHLREKKEKKKKKRQLLRNKPQNNTKQTSACSRSSPSLPLCMTSPSNINLTSYLVPQYRNNSVLFGDQQSLRGAEMAADVRCMASPLSGRTPEKTCSHSLNEILGSFTAAELWGVQ